MALSSYEKCAKNIVTQKCIDKCMTQYNINDYGTSTIHTETEKDGEEGERGWRTDMYMRWEHLMVCHEKTYTGIMHHAIMPTSKIHSQ